MKPGLLFTCILIGCCASAGAAVVTRGPYLQSAGSELITICWRTDVATTSEVCFGTAPDVLSVPVAESGTRTDHGITLSGLQPGTRYFYRVKGTPLTGSPVDLGGANHWFEMAPVEGTAQPTRIWVVGDSGYSNPSSINNFNAYLSETAAAGKRTDAFLMLGDNAYGIGSDNEYQSHVFNRYAGLLRNTPAWSTFGNHEAYTLPAPYTGPAPYDEIFRFPVAGECGGLASGSERYYSFNHGNIHFVSLDTNSVGYYDDVPGGTRE